MKKALAFLMAAVMLMSMLTACGNKDNAADNNDNNDVNTEETDKAAADKVAALIDAIYVQERTEETDAQCEACLLYTSLAQPGYHAACYKNVLHPRHLPIKNMLRYYTRPTALSMRQNVDICASFAGIMEKIGENGRDLKLSLALRFPAWYGRVGLTRSGGPFCSLRGQVWFRIAKFMLDKDTRLSLIHI